MTDLIAQAELTNLLPASRLAEVSATAEQVHELAAIACNCNSAANAGQTSTVWNKPISEYAMNELRINGYIVEPQRSASPGNVWVIRWAR